MATISTTDAPTVIAFPEGRHRVPVPTLALFLVFATCWDWICWAGDVMTWLKDGAEYIEDRVLTSRFALLPALVLGGTVVVAVVGWVANS